MNPSYTIEDVDIKTLYRMMLEHLRAGFRLVQIGATGREDGTELIYSVAKDYQMDNFRVFVESGEIINSISDIFPSAALLAELRVTGSPDASAMGSPEVSFPMRRGSGVLQC